MIVKVTRGVSASKALAYDYGPGRSQEHHNAHRVAGTSPGRDWRHRARGMQEQLRADGDTRANSPRRVWRLAVSAAPEDRILSDREWGAIATRVVGEFTHADPHNYTWEAVRHDARHIHITLLHRGHDGRVFREGKYKEHALRIAGRLERDYRLRELDRDAARAPETKQRRRQSAQVARATQQHRPRLDRTQANAPSAAAETRPPQRPVAPQQAPQVPAPRRREPTPSPVVSPRDHERPPTQPTPDIAPRPHLGWATAEQAAQLGPKPAEWDRWTIERRREYVAARLARNAAGERPAVQPQRGQPSPPTPAPDPQPSGRPADPRPHLGWATAAQADRLGPKPAEWDRWAPERQREYVADRLAAQQASRAEQERRQRDPTGQERER